VLRQAHVFGAQHLETIPAPLERRLLTVIGYGAAGVLGLALVIALGRYEDRITALLLPYLERFGLAIYAGCFLLASVVAIFRRGSPTLLRRWIDRVRGREPEQRD
jgi:hypothetical protein